MTMEHFQMSERLIIGDHESGRAISHTSALGAQHRGFFVVWPSLP
jgi:hypothetical protein